MYDHREIGRDMALFHFEEHSAGMVFWKPSGLQMIRALENFSRSLHEVRGYSEVRSPVLMGASAWERSGHWDKYGGNMFVARGGDGDGREYAVKPMSCPGHIALFASEVRGCNDMPVRYFEFGNVHRNEPSGALNGIMRLRSFVQDDAHVFCMESQVVEEVASYIGMAKEAYGAFGFRDLKFKIALRPADRVGDDAFWDRAEDLLRVACSAAGVDHVEAPGDGAFYGPKIEIALKDSLGREWQCGTIQADYVLPERFDLKYAAADGSLQRPVILHHAVLGSLERWLGILLENFGGDLPVWLAPVQVVVASVSGKAAEWAEEVCKSLKRLGVRAEADVSAERVGAKVRLHSKRKVPILLVVGEREASEKSVSVRRLGADLGGMPLADFIMAVSEEVGIPSL